MVATIFGKAATAGKTVAQVATTSSEMDPNILFGHGGFDSKMWTVPDGSSITFWTAPGNEIHENLGQAISTGGNNYFTQITTDLMPDVWGAHTALPGAVIPDYVLTPPYGLTVLGYPTTVYEWTRLSDLVGPDMGNVQWGACLSPLPE